MLPSQVLDADLEFFTTILGFRIDSIFPADEPAVAVLSGHGLRIRLARGADLPVGQLRLMCSRPADVADGKLTLFAPNGTQVELVASEPSICMPSLSQSFCVSKLHADAAWVVGRAGMEYRDLIPAREGGRFIASHIRIRKGGPVPDYVHYHRVRFQMIYCYRGWVRLVYDDQGEAFVMRPGDCVLQPPEIRHRVLECSDGLEVIEIGSPAEHITCVDHELELPTHRQRPDRRFGEQRFTLHEVEKATWRAGRHDGFEARDLGIENATQGVAGVVVIRRQADAQPRIRVHHGEFLFQFILKGGLQLSTGGDDVFELEQGDCFTVPAGLDHCLEDCSEDLELLEVRLPA